MSHVSDEAFARYVVQAGLARVETVEEARRFQAECAQRREPVPLAEALVRRGALTADQRQIAEAKLRNQRQGVQQLGNYRLLKKLGEGGMGTVYLAESTVMLRKVALKVLPAKFSGDAEFLTRFRREAKATGRLNHVNIVAAFDAGEDCGHHYYAMEYCEGESLDASLKRERCLLWDKALEIVIQVARGLQHAHQHGFIHRDIKPANIFVTSDGVAKILDLGLSKNIGGGEQSFNTETGMAVGTPHYISPEQARGEKSIDGRTDIYSLGASLYHLVTGEPPFHGSTGVVIMVKHLSEQLPNPQDIKEDLPDGVALVIAKMMAKAPADRHADCTELLADLEPVLNGKMPSSRAIDNGKSSIAVRVRTRGRQPQELERTVLAGRADKSHPAPKRAQKNGKGPADGKTLALPLILGAAVLLTAVALAVVMMRGNRNSPGGAEREASRQKPSAPEPLAPEPSAPEVAASTKAVATPADTAVDAPARWKGAVNLLSRVHLPSAVKTGQWQMSDAGLSSDATPFARLELPYHPAEEYDFRIDFTPVGVPDVNQLLTRFGNTFHFMPAGMSNQLTGFTLVAGQFENASTTRKSPCLNAGQRYNSIVQVRRDGLKAYLDGKLVAELKTDYRNLSPLWQARMTDSDALAVLSHLCPTVFHTIAVLELSGPGTFTRPGNPSGNDAR